MIKKLCLIFAAFTIGLFVSLSLQACADNDDTEPITKTPTADTHKFDAWKQPGIKCVKKYREDGLLVSCIDYKYDKNGWLIEEKRYGYGDKVYSDSTIVTYTYSESGDCQYCTSEYTSYENGTAYYTKKETSVKELDIE